MLNIDGWIWFSAMSRGGVARRKRRVVYWCRLRGLLTILTLIWYAWNLGSLDGLPSLSLTGIPVSVVLQLRQDDYSGSPKSDDLV